MQPLKLSCTTKDLLASVRAAILEKKLHFPYVLNLYLTSSHQLDYGLLAEFVASNVFCGCTIVIIASGDRQNGK